MRRRQNTMLKTGIVVAVLALLVIGCGVNKEYVQQQIAESEDRMNAKLSSLESQTGTNSGDIAKLQSLAKQLSEKADMAINEAKGFENYQVIWSGLVNFDFDSYTISDNAASILREAGQKMEEHPGSIIEIAGHTDRIGTNDYNFQLGEKRANAAKRFLVDNYGISLYRVFIVSHGEDKPVAMPDEKDANSKNRRVNLKVWGTLR
ncbi:MAG: OmpA family protein [Candidatus Zixiibacteriota bacterium]